METHSSRIASTLVSVTLSSSARNSARLLNETKRIKKINKTLTQNRHSILWARLTLISQIIQMSNLTSYEGIYSGASGQTELRGKNKEMKSHRTMQNNGSSLYSHTLIVQMSSNVDTDMRYWFFTKSNSRSVWIVLSVVQICIWKLGPSPSVFHYFKMYNLRCLAKWQLLTQYH